VPIPDLVRDGDTRIVIHPGVPLLGFIPSDGPPPDVLADYTAFVDRVVVARIESRVAHLTADSFGIETTVGARVIDQLKPDRPRQPFVQFVQQGGIIEVQGVPIEWKAAWAGRLDVGEQYLLFVGGQAVSAGVTWSYRITPRGALESMFPGFPESPDTPHGMSLDRAKQIIRESSRRP
jgi:hypothetical protein